MEEERKENSDVQMSGNQAAVLNASGESAGI
jgi:hypothetical protein